MKRLSALVLVVALGVACGKNAPVVTPDAQQAFDKVRVVNALNLLRDIAVVANAQTPPVISDATLVKVNTYYNAAIGTVNASGHGWAVTLSVALDEVVKTFPEHEQGALGFYTGLLRSLFAGLK
jgi:hypothetical protein